MVHSQMLAPSIRVSHGGGRLSSAAFPSTCRQLGRNRKLESALQCWCWYREQHLAHLHLNTSLPFYISFQRNVGTFLLCRSISFSPFPMQLLLHIYVCICYKSKNIFSFISRLKLYPLGKPGKESNVYSQSLLY